MTRATVRLPDITSSISRSERGCAAANGTTVSGKTTVPRSGSRGSTSTVRSGACSAVAVPASATVAADCSVCVAAAACGWSVWASPVVVSAGPTSRFFAFSVGDMSS
jgi:hypothetical protein